MGSKKSGQVQFKLKGEALEAELPHDLVQSNLKIIHKKVLAETGKSGTHWKILRIHCKAVKNVDASGLLWLLSLESELQNRDQHLALCGVSKTLSQAFQFFRLERMLENN